MISHHAVFTLLTLVAPTQAAADDAKAPGQSIEEIASRARPSVVVIHVTGRDGRARALGTGFVVDADGLIATNLHVIGEARPISVELADGKRHEVTSVHASDRALDLALLKVDAKGLPALPLGDSEQLKPGQSVVAIGNPHGLARSVVAGVVSELRELDGRPMIQLAIPLEAGNSGGPLLDREGRVQGILTMKSLVTNNLGFAVAINSLKPLVKKPNPVPMARWLLIGTLSPDEWKPLFGASWRKRGGKIHVEGAGSGFGGRSLCLWQPPVPAAPFEVAVTVRLDHEAGAAGLIFHSDGNQRHYGFYPSSGQLRFTRFDGADVFSWKVLHQEGSVHYRPGEWNTLKVAVDKDRIRCFVNGEAVFETRDAGLTEGHVGLAKFRDTRAEFKEFRVAKELPGRGLSPALSARLAKTLESLEQGPPPGLVDALKEEATASVPELQRQARRLEQQAAALKELAAEVHARRVQDDLARVLGEKEADLFHAALLIARLDNEDIDVAAYRRDVERMAKEVSAKVAKDADEGAKLAALNAYLFEEQGFHGSRSDYYNRSNSYLSDVIDDREGLPITLSVLYMHLAAKLGVKAEGVGLPGHFVVRHVPAKGESKLIDVYEGAKVLSAEDAEQRVRDITGGESKPEHHTAMSPKAIIVRMLHNLLGLSRRDRDVPATLRYLDTILAIAPDSAQERWVRAVLRYQLGRRDGAREDADWLLEHRPEGIELERVRELRKAVERE